MGVCVMSDWRDRASCRDYDPELWFPASTGDSARHYPIAAAICRDCPVRIPCLEHALAIPEHYGMFGGLTETQRDSLRRREQRQARR